MDAITAAAVDEHYYEIATPGSLTERVVVVARSRIFADFMRIVRPHPDESILDVGISDVLGDAANVLERCYPHRGRITAAGLGSAERFQAEFPEIGYHRIEPNQPLPFADGAFDIATANAVLEHVGSPDNQRRFLAELCRVARRVYVIVPHRFFPIEHHTGIPLLHWADFSFGLACGLFGKSRWAGDDSLILMSRRRLIAVCPAERHAEIGYTGIVLGPLSANLFCYMREASEGSAPCLERGHP